MPPEALRFYRIEHPTAVQPRDARIFTRAVLIVPRPEGGVRQIQPRAEQAILDIMRENPRLGVRTAAKV